MIQILISTMYLKDPVLLLDKMNIQTEAVIIDQCDDSFEEKIEYKDNEIKIVHTTERGLSKSRNMAIRNATAEVVIFADDDFRYEDGYPTIVEEAYNNFLQADAIVFGAIRADKYVYRTIPDGKMDSKYKFSINSIRMSARRKSLIEKKVSFDENFGTGADVSSGEDTIFISDCFNKGMVMYSKDSVICCGFDDGRESTWWHGYNEKFFEDKGSVYKRLSRHYLIFILYFAVKQYKQYKNQFNLFSVIRFMLKGVKKQKVKKL